MKSFKLLLTLLILASWACSGPDESQNKVITDAAKARLDSALNEMVESRMVAGASALIFEKGEEVYFHATGFADREAQKPMGRNTIAIIYSMTKPVTGVALMTLYEKGAFQLDDPLEKYAPEFANMQVFSGVDSISGVIKLEPLNRPITIRDITRHTAGFAINPNQPGLGELLKAADAGNPNNTLVQMAEKMGTVPLMFQPGTQWAYGPSVDVQAFLVERLSGKPYGEYVRENVLDPLGMSETRYFVPEADRGRMSAMYRRGEDESLSQVPDSIAHAFNTKEWALTPGGYGLTSTLDDYMKFTQMLVNEGTYNGVTILKPETVQLMATNQLDDSVTERMFLPSKGNVGFGIDFAVRVAPTSSPEENMGVVGEFFWDGAASTLFWVDPKHDLTAVLFVQVMPFAGQVHKKFRDAVYGPYVAQPEKK
ncbi:CubicO group peptidase (beta-lactamase class C family) [Algoriphagus boseongensis]|uniref:CubicO group peptidase (Beta-lactamase class C family) n=1 Tax=Algoriphagus boseongensis TaxID=1442587 RepID=A0A4R6T852_9BACT|nr:serine hydrolase domain-containing protein [Algoriphagus boseongensis]TDQ18876.1 CubicO group peptidase (beta-lactamase class C family) [Algoriphagus boseongensis]